MVLWDFGLVVDFPAGSTVLIPSAIVVHSNTMIKSSETRFSIVQYVAGGLFRWVENGYSTQDHNSKEGWEQNGQWEKAIKMFSHISDLVKASTNS